MYATEGISAVPEMLEQGVDAVPDTEDQGIDALEVDYASSESSEDPITTKFSMPPLLSTFTPSLHGIITLPMRAVRIYTYYLTLPVRYMLSFTPLVTPVSSPTRARIEDASTKVSDPELENSSEKIVHHMSSFASSHENHVTPSQNASTDANSVSL